MQPDDCGQEREVLVEENRDLTLTARFEALSEQLAQATDDRRRADCMSRIQSDVMQLALDLLVKETDIDGFFRFFLKSLVDECESRASGVWLLDDNGSRCDLWMAYAQSRLFMKESEDWEPMSLPRESMASHLREYREGWTAMVEYTGDDARLPLLVREFNRCAGVESLVVAPLMLPDRNLGWVALSTGPRPHCETIWRQAVVEAVARQATLALHQSRLAEQSRLETRRQAVLEERNRIARDIHDTLTQGFAAILMQLQAAQRFTPAVPPEVASILETGIDLARTHIIEARRSVGALRPQSAADEDVAVALHRMADLARRTTDVPIDLTVEGMPDFGGGVEREIIGIAQEALTNAVRHSRARRITIHASAVRALGFRLSVADDGRGIAKEHRGAGFGMTSMQERAERIGASLTVVTAPRAGTQVVLAWEPASFSVPVQDYAAV